MPPIELPRLMLAAPASGSGKTSVAIGLLQALLNRGIRPAAFKCGPDYIDPMFHRRILGVEGRNLDLFFTGPDIVRGLLADGFAGADIAVLEGVMGYYDGVGASDAASSWRVAEATDTPTVLIVRPKGTFLSLAAVVNGFRAFRDDSMIRGVIVNRCPESFYDKIRPVLERETGLPVYGHLPDMPSAHLESRHLGLVTPEKIGTLEEKIAELAAAMERSVDIDGLVALAKTAPALDARLPDLGPPIDPRPRIAVARDEAFCFYYRENMRMLETLGAELVPFSPLNDQALPDDIDALYFGGGYPELYAEALARQTSMRASIRDAVAGGTPTLAECGGFLYLQEELEDGDGRAHEMVGVLPGRGFNTRKLGRFGYVVVQAKKDSLLADAGGTIKAHEFHYWDSSCCGDDCVAEKADGSKSWECVHAGNSVFAGFPHLYFWSNPDFARRFVVAAASRRRGRMS